MNVKHFINWLMPALAITTAAKLERLEAENDRLRAQVQQCQMALATWATDAESFRIDAEVWKERAEKWQEIAIQLSPAQQISSSMPWGKN